MLDGKIYGSLGVVGIIWSLTMVIFYEQRYMLVAYTDRFMQSLIALYFQQLQCHLEKTLFSLWKTWLACCAACKYRMNTIVLYFCKILTFAMWHEIVYFLSKTKLYTCVRRYLMKRVKE